MNNTLIQSQIKSIEEELQTIKIRLSNSSGKNKKNMSSLKDMFPQEIEYNTIKEGEFKIKDERLNKL